MTKNFEMAEWNTHRTFVAKTRVNEKCDVKPLGLPVFARNQPVELKRSPTIEVMIAQAKKEGKILMLDELSFHTR